MLPLSLVSKSLKMDTVRSGLIITLMTIIAFNATFMMITIERVTIPLATLTFIFSLTSTYFLTLDSSTRANQNIKVLETLGAKKRVILTSIMPIILFATMIGSLVGALFGFFLAYYTTQQILTISFILLGIGLSTIIPIFVGAIFGNVIGVFQAWKK